MPSSNTQTQRPPDLPRVLWPPVFDFKTPNPKFLLGLTLGVPRDVFRTLFTAAVAPLLNPGAEFDNNR